MDDPGQRIDVWMWRARLFKTRALAAVAAADGRIRLARAGEGRRVTRAAQIVRIDDELIFAIGARIVAVRVAGLGARRGPPAEARALYVPLDA